MQLPSIVSIVIPAYNASDYIEDTLKSVLCQTYSNIEVLLINDGSTDDTKSRIESYFSDKRVKYIYQPNSGLPSARNTGIQASIGHLIMFVDSDDLLPQGAIEALVKNLEKLDSSYCAVHGEMERFQNGSNKTLGITDYSSFSSSREKLITLRANFLLTCLIRKEAVIDAGMFHASMKQDAEDYDFIFRLSKLGRFKAINEVVYKYRIRSTSKSQNLSLQRVTEQIKERYQMFLRVLPDEKLLTRLKGWSVHYFWAGVDIHRHNPLLARRYWLQSLLFNPFQLEPLKLLRASVLNKIP